MFFFLKFNIAESHKHPFSMQVYAKLRLEWRAALLRHRQRLVDNARKATGREEGQNLGVEFGRKDLRIARQHKQTRRKVVGDDRVGIFSFGVERAKLDDPICSGKQSGDRGDMFMSEKKNQERKLKKGHSIRINNAHGAPNGEPGKCTASWPGSDAFGTLAHASTPFTGPVGEPLRSRFRTPMVPFGLIEYVASAHCTSKPGDGKLRGA